MIAHLLDRRPHRLEAKRERLEQLRRREHAADVVPGLEDRDGLIDDVILVGLQVLAPALLDELDDPARIEIDAEADAAAVLREVLDRQAQPARARRPEHQPVRALREELVGQRLAEQLVVDAEVLATRRASSGCRSCRRSRTRRSACPASPFGIQRCTGPPRSHSSWNSPKRCRSAKVLISRRGSQPAFFAKSSQNGVPVAGSKCQSTTSRIHASRDSCGWPVGEEGMAS